MNRNRWAYVALTAAVLLFGLPGVAGAAPAGTAPTVSLSMVPTSLSAGGGPVDLSATMTLEGSCTLSVVPSISGLPACTSTSNPAIPIVQVPANTTMAPTRYKFTVTVTGLITPSQTASASTSVTVAAPAATTYLALGDSYSSGEGNPGSNPKPWVDHSGNPSPINDGCDRSAVAYPELTSKWLASQTNLPSMKLSFLACSGATTENLWNSGANAAGLAPAGGDGGEPQQLLDTGELANARIVTLTIGGNDLNFSDILSNCIDSALHYCNAQSDDGWIADLAKNIQTLQPILLSTYEQIEAEAPNAALYVVAYPDIFSIHPSVGCSLLSLSAIKYLASQETPLLNVIQSAAAEAGAHLVNPNATNAPSSFVGHDVCAGTSSWFNKVNLNDQQYSFHPNHAGQAALAADIEAAIAQNSTPSLHPSLVTIPATSNPWGAGSTELPDPAGGGGGTLPPSVSLPSGTTSVSIAAGGLISISTGGGLFGPGGLPGGLPTTSIRTQSVPPVGGISGIVSGTWDPLVGVFGNGAAPSANPPRNLSYENTYPINVSPSAWQLFYIGNGFTPGGTQESIHVPSGATELYLGIPDCYPVSFSDPNSQCIAGYFYDNGGSFSADVELHR